MNKIIRLFLIELSWYVYENKDGISVEEFITILNVCSILTTNPHYKVRLDSFIYELQKNRNRDPTLQLRYLNNVTSYLIYKYFSNNNL
ncbi:hypothetical protein [Streptococcus uberis]|uniref:hypothetical protein n=1 Tax=Streptococcus uberis TaxID=1349 RepID=UPI0012B51A2B|nr:hypothetical protein [Streptococcus uberis]MTB35412.1 hypothetical protein [Streptococcus uberis]MTB55002.1 hypothetical protein [Streptococcus uberis]MTB56637.1 hypothetical protein [Streptococcus uberis]MTB60464.1 hypothetical protein [Streptococcus uberis]